MSTFLRSRMCWVIMLLMLVLNVGVFGISYRYLTKVDANYSRLLDEGIPLLRDMQTATIEASRGYGLMVDLSRAETDQDIARLETELAAQREVSDRIFSSDFDEKAVPVQLRSAYEEIRYTRREGKIQFSTFLSLVAQHNRTAAAAYLQQEIYPAHKAYLTRLDAFCDLCDDSFAAVHRQLALDNSRGRSIFLGMAVAPMALLVGIAITGLLALIVLVVISLTPMPESRIKT